MPLGPCRRSLGGWEMKRRSAMRHPAASVVRHRPSKPIAPASQASSAKTTGRRALIFALLGREKTKATKAT